VCAPFICAHQVPPEDAKQSMRITFEGEQGVDVGGLEREWFVLAAEAAFAPEAGLFVLPLGSSGYRIDPCGGGFLGNPDTGQACSSTQTGGGFWCQEEQLEHMEFVGRLLGKAVLERQSLPVALTTSLLKHLLGAPCTPADLTDLDPELAKHLTWLLSASADEVEACCLDFTVTTTYTPPEDNNEEEGAAGRGSNNYKRRPSRGRAFAVGEVVECRDGDEPWERGIVCGYAKDGSKVRPFVQRVDMDAAYVWDEVRKMLDDDDDGGDDDDDHVSDSGGVAGLEANGSAVRRSKSRRGAADTSSEEEEGEEDENEVVYEATLVRANDKESADSIAAKTDDIAELEALIALLDSEGLLSSHLDTLLTHGVMSVAQLASVLAEREEGEEARGGEEGLTPKKEDVVEDQANSEKKEGANTEALPQDAAPVTPSASAVLSCFKKAQLLKLCRAVQKASCVASGDGSGGGGGGGGASRTAGAADAPTTAASVSSSASASSPVSSGAAAAAASAGAANPYGKLTRLLFGHEPLGLTVLHEDAAAAAARPGSRSHRNGSGSGSGRLCVTAVEPGRLAHAQGIEVGDWLVELNGQILSEGEADQTFLQNLSSLPKPVLLGFAKHRSASSSLHSASRRHHRASASSGGSSRVSSSSGGGSGKKRTVVVTHELKPGGQDMVVNLENRLEYCQLLTQWHLGAGIEAPLFRLLEGFYTVRLYGSLFFFQFLSKIMVVKT